MISVILRFTLFEHLRQLKSHYIRNYGKFNHLAKNACYAILLNVGFKYTERKNKYLISISYWLQASKKDLIKG